ncbi:hypothetical protein BX070DRAFT_218787 [Coemansia spiralis]|nr:hypothetical protein BX070DRAFT_218787 [Coemansia spiralis]
MVLLLLLANFLLSLSAWPVASSTWFVATFISACTSLSFGFSVSVINVTALPL